VAPVQVLAIDIGGTKLAAGLVDADGTMLSTHRAPTPTRGGAEPLFAAVVAVAESALRHAAAQGTVPVAPVAVGVGCGGPMTAGGEAVSPLNIEVWRDFPLRARLAAQFDLPTFVDNDAKALARAEGWLGAAAGARDFIGMVVSTGVGGGIVVDGRLLEGASGNAGHIGHVVVEPDGRPCACGGRGCLEAEASGPSIEAAFGLAPADAPIEVRARTGTLVGRAVASLVSALDIRLATVAGSVALGFGAPFFEAANAEVRLRCGLSYTEGAVVVPARLGDRGPLVGAAAVALAGLGRPPWDR
jgi:glucokinase